MTGLRASEAASAPPSLVNSVPTGGSLLGTASPTYPALPDAKGLVVPGNIKGSGIWDRKILRNPDGSYSTTSSMSIGTDKGEVLIPTVVNGKRMTAKQAIAHFDKTGEHLGIFDSPEDADAYAEELHNAQAKYIEMRGLNK